MFIINIIILNYQHFNINFTYNCRNKKVFNPIIPFIQKYTFILHKNIIINRLYLFNLKLFHYYVIKKHMKQTLNILYLVSMILSVEPTLIKAWTRIRVSLYFTTLTEEVDSIE